MDEFSFRDVIAKSPVISDGVKQVLLENENNFSTIHKRELIAELLQFESMVYDAAEKFLSGNELAKEKLGNVIDKE